MRNVLIFVLALIFPALIFLSKESIYDSASMDSTFQSEKVLARPSFRSVNFYHPKFFEKPVISGRAAIVVDLESGFNLFAVNTHQNWPIASITKLMSALITREKIGNNAIIKIEEGAVLTEGISGGFRVGESYSSLDLIKAMLIVSSNDAAEAVANYFGRENFVEEMNQKAEDLGMQSTKFYDPTGLNLVNQSTIDDLMLLTKYILAKHNELFKISTERQILIEDLMSGRKNLLTNINTLVSVPYWAGGKTGFIEESGGNLLSIFDYNNKYLIIVLGSEDRFGDTLKLWEWSKVLIKS